MKSPLRKFANMGMKKTLIISDLHSNFLDKKAFDIVLQIYKENHFDQLVINGDLLDFPIISEHTRRIEVYSPEIIDAYSLDDEIDFTIEEILQKLYMANPDCPILVRLGNHEERFIRPTKTNTKALSSILEVSRKRGARLEEMLRLDEFNAKLSYNGVDRIGGFTLIHGVSCTEYAAKKNLLKYGSGSSGHTHRANSKVQTYHGGTRGWWESGCLRTTENIEYLPRGEIADWQHGFLTLTTYKNWFDCQTHLISNYKCLYNGQLYSTSI